MRTTLLLMSCAAMALAVPIGDAHVTGQYGIPKTYCENTTGDTWTHDYGPVAVGTFAFMPTDGSVGDCNFDGTPGDEDFHREFAQGGAILLACDVPNPCTGPGASACWGQVADHKEMTPISVFDYVLGPSVFTVGIDFGTPLAPCGDNVIDISMTCFGTCIPWFPAGSSGAYMVFATGTLGHVYN